MEKITGLNLGDLIYTAFGASKESKIVRAGLLASATHSRLKSELVRILRANGIFYEEAILTANQAWRESLDTLTKAEPVLIDKEIVQVSFRRAICARFLHRPLLPTSISNCSLFLLD